MKFPKYFFIYLFIAGPIIILCFTLIFTGQVSFLYRGFGIDSRGYLYVGKDHNIEVLLDGKVVRELSPMTSRGYAFTINLDDTITLSTGTELFTLNSNGEVLSNSEDKNNELYKLKENRHNFIAADGRQYELINTMGYYKINYLSEEGVKNIYRMPIFDYVIEILLIACYVAGFIVILKTIVQSRKVSGEKTSSVKAFVVNDNIVSNPFS